MEVGGDANSMLLLPLKLRSVGDVLPFGVSPLVSGSDAELKLLLPKHRAKIILEKERISW